MKTNHRTTFRQSKYVCSKYWGTLKATLTKESNYLPAKLTLQIHPASPFLISLMLIFYFIQYSYLQRWEF